MSDFAHEIRHEDVAQGGSGNLVLKEDEQRFPDLILLSPLGLFVLAIYMRNYSTLSVSVGSAGTTTIGRVELLHGLPWWPDDGAHGTYSSPIHPL